MSIRDKIKPSFARLQGGLFSKVDKADVGSSYAALGERGIALMGWADPFYPDPSLPAHVLEATVKCLEKGTPSHYTMPIGNIDLRIEIAKKLKRVNGIQADPERNIIVTPGSDSGLFYSMIPFIGPGDEVMVTDPSYPSNFVNPELMGGVTVRVPLYEEDNYQFNVDEFKKRLTKRTKMVLLTHPNNPTTTVFRRQNIMELAEFIVKNDLILVVDQAFESTVFDNIEYISIAALPGMFERTVTVFSISKGMGLSGYRVGYIAACDEIMDVLYGGAVNVLGATNTAAQVGAIAAMRDDSFIEEYNKIHDRRRKIAYDIFNSIPGVKMLMPESGFYSWINVSNLGDSSDICRYLLNEANVAVNDGKAYGNNGAGHIRVIHGSLRSDGMVFDALQRMREALVKLAADKG